jgi:hypothetical protein
LFPGDYGEGKGFSGDVGRKKGFSLMTQEKRRKKEGFLTDYRG